MSKTTTEWVSAPDGDEVDPGLGDLAGPLQGEAARRLQAGPAARDPDRLGHGRRVHVVEQDPVAARVEQGAELVEVGDLDLDGQVRVRRADRLVGRHHAAGRDDVVVLDHRHVAEREPVVDAPAAPDGVLLQGAQARQRLAGVQHPGAGALQGVDPARVAVATPERWQARLRAVRSAVSSPRVGPSTRITTSPAATRLPSATPVLDARGRRPAPRAEHQLGDAQPRHHAGAARAEVGDRPRVGGDGGLAGDVDAASGRSSSSAATTMGVDVERVEARAGELVDEDGRQVVERGHVADHHRRVGLRSRQELAG